MAELVYQTLRENVASEIRRRILEGELRPGAHIVEQSLSRELGVSRGPIREALRQLEQEGLVEYVRNAGCTVREINAADVYEICMLRTGYETVAVWHCGGRYTEEDFASCEEVLAKMSTLTDGDMPSLIACDHEFHRIFIRRAGLSRLTKLWEDLNYGTGIVGANSGPYRDHLAGRQAVIHRELLQTFRQENGNPPAICRKLFEHYVLPVQNVIMEGGLKLEDFPIFSSCPPCP